MKKGPSQREDEDSTLLFSQKYETKKKLSSGSFGTVYTCIHKRCASDNHHCDDDFVYAVKVINRARLKQKDEGKSGKRSTSEECVFREVALLRELHDLPQVVDLMDFFVEPTNLYMVLSFAPGGDVFERLMLRSSYTEKNAHDLAKKLLETIRALQSTKPFPIVHRDLKPENLLLRDRYDDTSILLADFGFARHVQPDQKCQTRCGTPMFVAPEVLLGGQYGLPVDLWSTGCLLYMLICGYVCAPRFH